MDLVSTDYDLGHAVERQRLITMFQEELGSEVAKPQLHDSQVTERSGNILGVTGILMERAVLNYSRRVAGARDDLKLTIDRNLPAYG